MLKRKDKLISENKIPIKYVSYLYSYVLCYIFVHDKFIKLMDKTELYPPTKFFDLVKKLFKSNLLTIKYDINIFNFYFYNFIIDKNNIFL